MVGWGCDGGDDAVDDGGDVDGGVSDVVSGAGGGGHGRGITVILRNVCLMNKQSVSKLMPSVDGDSVAGVACRKTRRWQDSRRNSQSFVFVLRHDRGTGLVSTSEQHSCGMLVV